MKTLIRRIKKILVGRRLQGQLRRVISVIACVVVFATTYALVLPAITMESLAQCGIEAHEHTAGCYEKVLVCGQEETGGHSHTDECWQTEKVLVCELEEHTHGPECRDAEGNLTCEKTEHTHDENCWREEKTLICGMEEAEGHTHTDACYEDQLICGKEVHIHSPECYQCDDAGFEDFHDTGDFSTDQDPAWTEESGDVSAGDTDFSDGDAFTEDTGFAGEGDFTEDVDFANEGEFTEDMSFANDGEFTEDVSFTNAGEFTEDVSFDGAEEFAEEGSAEAGDFVEEAGYAGGEEPAGEPAFAEEATPADDAAYMEETAAGTPEEFTEEGGPVGDEYAEAADPAAVENARTGDKTNDPGSDPVEAEGPETPDGTGTENDSGTVFFTEPDKGQTDPAGIAADEGAVSEEDGSVEKKEAADAAADTAGTAKDVNAADGSNAAENNEKAGGSDPAGDSANSEDALDEAAANEEENRAQAAAVEPAAPADLEKYLTDQTGIWYYPAVFDQEGKADTDAISSESITDWKKAEADTVLSTSDFLRLYLAYTIPAGTLSDSAPLARYVLPANMHLTPDQIEAINAHENGYYLSLAENGGKAGQTEDGTGHENGDPAAAGNDNANITTAGTALLDHLGAEAIEGRRTPDQAMDKDAQEFISATVKAAEIYDEDGNLLYQELVFYFLPYTIEKNRTVYATSGATGTTDSGNDQLEAFAEGEGAADAAEFSGSEEGSGALPEIIAEGEEVAGFFTVDFAIGQIDFADTDTEEIKQAEIVLVDKNAKEGIGEIRETLKVNTSADFRKDAEEAEKTDGNTKDQAADGQTADGQETADQAKNNQDKKEIAADTKDVKNQDKDTETNPAKDPDMDQDKAQEKVRNLLAGTMPAQSFEDSISIDTIRPASVGDSGSIADAADVLPARSLVKVRVEADEGTFPAGTTMVLKAVDSQEMDAVAEAVESAVAAGQEAENNKKENEKNTAKTKTCGFQAVDISFRDAEGNEIEPAKPVRVAMTSSLIQEAAQVKALSAPVVVHVDNEGKGEQLTLIDPEEIDPARGRTEEELLREAENRIEEEQVEEETDQIKNKDDQTAVPEDTAESSKDQTEVPEAATESAKERTEEPATATESEEGLTSDEQKREEVQEPAAEGQIEEKAAPDGQQGLVELENTAANEDTVGFETSSFSIYAIVYTVDFYWEVNGKMYEFSLPGGGFVSFTDLVEVLGISSDTNSVENEADDVEKKAAEADKNDMEAASLMLNDVMVSEKTKEFVANVASAEFSSPELVWVGKVENDSTVGRLKEAKGLECEYSAELTEEQIVEINSTVVEAGDWALISLQPFTSEETLKVSMKDGEVFTIRVTDYQISTNILTADGKTYKITVTFDDDAEIPTGTKLIVTEIEKGSDEYLQYIGRTWVEVNKKYFEQEKLKEKDEDYIAEEIPLVNIDKARFFNVSLMYGDQEIEPKAPVQVDIRFVDGLGVDGIEKCLTGVSHFVDSETADSVMKEDAAKRNRESGSEGTAQTAEALGQDTSVELIKDVQTEKDADNRIVRFTYDQESFSVIGTYVGHETRDSEEELSVPKLKLRTRDVRGTGALDTPDPTKILSPNIKSDGTEDGTYKLSLSVTGDRKEDSETETRKSNVLFVMDRSSSMTRDLVQGVSYEPYTGTEYDNGITFYGIVNGRYQALNYNSDIGFFTSQWGWGGQTVTPYNTENGLFVRIGNRFDGEQAALRDLFGQLLAKNEETGENSDNIEISVISFATKAGDQSGWSGTEVGWTGGTNPAVLNTGVNKTDNARGTNWEEALKYAKRVMDDKKAAEVAEGHDNEDYYIVFLTDGAPTATTYSMNVENGAYYGTEGHTATQTDSQGRPRNSCEPAYQDATDDARALIDAGYKLYNIFTFGTNEDYKYMIRLTNYAYHEAEYVYDNIHDNVEPTDYFPDSPNAQKYFTNATDTEKLVDAFKNIFSEISVTQGHAQVRITDGLRQDALTSTFVNGKPSGVTYTVAPKDSPNTPIYTVTATVPEDSSEPVVTFKIGNNEYSTADNQVVKHVKDPVEGNPLASYDAGTYYSVTVDGVEYKMALATVVPTANENVSTLTWDLSPVGMLMDDCVYKADFIVWPNQDAYDYVAALNNGLTEIADPENETAEPIPVIWDQSTAIPKEDSRHKVYYEGGCAKYPSIVYYPDPDKEDDPDKQIYYGTFAVLTNTDQNLDYSIVTTEDGEVTSVEPQDTIPMELPDPMPLEDTSTFVLKKWIVDRDAGVLAQYLYDLEGNPKKFQIRFNIYQGEAADSADPYTSVVIGWDETAGEDGKGAYVWEGPFVNADYGNSSYRIGTHWKADFDISAGLMLSDARMTELKLDKTGYPSAQFGNTTYYILEPGHDYTIKEDGENIGYEFDFVSPVYHPMLVDGVMKNVEITKTGSSYIINSIASTPLDSLGLKIENNLRAYLHLNKVVVDKDNNPLPNDKTRFEYTVDIHSPIKLEGTHIPWYGVNDLFYHDEEFNYYQADPIFEGENQKEGVLTLKTESGYVCQAVCEGMFNPDIAGPTTVHYVDEDGEDQEIELYGNNMTADSNQQDIQARVKINQDERLTIANIPAESTYSITETQAEGYELVSIVADQSATRNGYNISGTILQNSDNNVTYKNRLKSGALKLTKVVQIDGKAPASDQYTLVDGDYLFTVENAEDNTFEVTKYVQITVMNGVAVSYKIANTEDALSESETVTGLWAILTNLAAGDYVITETAERNGLLLTDIARGDASETAPDLENSRVTVHVTVDDTAAAGANARATFTNNYYNNDGPDKTALDIVKTFNGLVSPADLPDDFRVVICYSVPGKTDPIEIPLKKGQNETIETADGEHIKVKETTDGFTLSWHITGIPSSATAFKIKEANYDTVTGYNFTAASLDGNDITETAGGWHELSVTAPAASLTNVTNERRTSDSGANVQFVLEEGDILLSKLTANQGTLVISKESLNTLERKAVEAGWPSQGGFKTPPRYFSIDEHLSGFKYGGKEITFNVRESDGKTIVTFTQNASAQEAVFAVTYDSADYLNNAALTNTYIQKEVTLELIKVDSTDMTTPLEHAQFTLRKLDPEGRGYYLTGSDAVEKISGETDAEGRAAITGITDGYYEISETRIPAGYVLVDSGKFFIKVVNGNIIRITKTEDDPATPDEDESKVRYWAEVTDQTDNIRFVSTQAAIPDDPETVGVDESAEAVTTYKVGNTPGAALPFTGGHGTRIYTILGSILILGAGVLLWRKRRLI